MLQAYREQAEERAQLGIPPLPLNAEQTAELCETLEKPAGGGERILDDLAPRPHPPRCR